MRGLQHCLGTGSSVLCGRAVGVDWPKSIGVSSDHVVVVTRRRTAMEVVRSSFARAVVGFNIVHRQAASAKTNNASRNLPTLRAHVELEIPTMGCVACIRSIDAALLHSDGVQQASAALHTSAKKGGKAVIDLVGASEQQIQDRTSALCSAVEKAGFGGCIVKIRTMAIDQS
jgi:copper chaperone CopZ